MDEDEHEPERIEYMKNEVMGKGRSPGEVRAEREAERQSFTWATWLDELRAIITKVKMEDIPKRDPRTKETLVNMWEIIDSLGKKGGSK